MDRDIVHTSHLERNVALIGVQNDTNLTMISKKWAIAALFYLGFYFVLQVGSVIVITTDSSPVTTTDSAKADDTPKIWINSSTSSLGRDDSSTLTTVDRSGSERKPAVREPPQNQINESQTSTEWIIRIYQSLSFNSPVTIDLDHVYLIATFLSSSNLFIAFHRIAKALERGPKKRKTEDLRLKLIALIMGLHALVKYRKWLPIERRNGNIQSILLSYFDRKRLWATLEYSSLRHSS